MQYILLINGDEKSESEMTEEAMGQLMAAYGEFSQALVDAKAMVDGNRLQPTSTATTVRVRAGETITTDGPFAETKEQFGGYYIIDVPNLDDAITWAARVPTAKYGSVEVRPVWMMGE